MNNLLLTTVETITVMDFKIKWTSTGKILSMETWKDYKMELFGKDEQSDNWIGVGIYKNNELIAVENAEKF